MNAFEKVSNNVMHDTNASDMRENAIYWTVGDKYCTVNLMQGRYISRLRKLAEDRPDEVKIESDRDGIMIATFPVKYIKINPPREAMELSDEEREIRRKRLREYAEYRKHQ